MIFAQPGCFVTGSRGIITEMLTNQVLRGEFTSLTPLMKGVRNSNNVVRIPLMAYLYRTLGPSRFVKGCNMAFWRSDLIRVNGYDEEFRGWGGEDSELATRLNNSGVRQRCMKFRGIVFHLYHGKCDRDRQSANEERYKQSLSEHRTRCRAPDSTGTCPHRSGSYIPTPRLPSPQAQAADRIPTIFRFHMLVSVITPVYNTEKYLDECIGSILSQSMTDFELAAHRRRIDRTVRAQSATVTLKVQTHPRIPYPQRRRQRGPKSRTGQRTGRIRGLRGLRRPGHSGPPPTTRRQQYRRGRSRLHKPVRRASRKRQAPQRTHPDLCDTGLPGHGRPGCLHARTGAAAAQTLPRLDLQQNVLARHDRTARPALRPQHPIRRRRDIHGPVLRPYHPPRQQQQPHIPLPVRPHESAARKDRPDDADAHTPLHPRTVQVAGLLRRDTLPHDPDAVFAPAPRTAQDQRLERRAGQRVGAGHTGQLEVLPRLRPFGIPQGILRHESPVDRPAELHDKLPGYGSSWSSRDCTYNI